MPTSHRTLSAGLFAGLVLVVGAILFMSRLGTSPESTAAPVATTPTPAVRPAPVDPVDVAALPVELQVDRSRAPLATVAEQFRNRVAASPDDHISLTVLAGTVLAQAAEEADSDLYAEAERLADEALMLAPTSIDAQLVKIGAVAARHDFETARSLASAILSATPDHVGARRARADADLALGDTTAADTAFLALAEEDRDPGIISRLSRTAFLRGDVEGSVDLAIEALVAAEALPLRPSDASFYWFQLGFVLFEGGDVHGAAAALERSVEITPDHPGANELLARVRTSQGRVDDAIAILRGLLDRGPAADLHGELATALELTGRTEEAAAEIEAGLAMAAETIGTNPAERRHLTSFLIDHDPATALRLAEEDFAERKDVYAYDTLAWALHANGEFDRAAELIEVALTTGLVDADVFFHAGMIAAAIGDNATAVDHLRATLELNPTFDPVDARVATELLDELTPSG